MPFVVPDTCTLPTADRPPRLAEFDALLTTAVRAVESLTPTHARLSLAGPPDLETAVRDLTAREASCCSFFTFTVSPAHDDSPLTLDVRVPPGHADVLRSLVGRAAAAAPGPAR
ncbi:hypothetical protein [Polymorphospora sp. NPDC050346]|uniref:hypothetical protein n=1 Tax=Polymorphospora sp. NPDC050346 TaxID=3155780 RepID=UPI0033C33626